MPVFYGAVSPPSFRPHLALESNAIRVLPRQWHASILDWAFLSTTHELQVEYQLADVLARGVGAELSLNAHDLADAKSKFAHLNALLLAFGTIPFFMPFVSTHSLDDFSNLEGASKDPADKRHERAQAITTRAETVVLGWMSLQVSLQATQGTSDLSQDIVDAATEQMDRWSHLTATVAEIRMLELALLSAPAATSTSQAILHVWTALENLYPNVQSEVSYRLALNVAQMIAQPDRRSCYDKVRRAYAARSNIAQGSQLSDAKLRRAWDDSWSLLTGTVRAILRRGGLPSEQELMDELIGAADGCAVVGPN